MLAGNVALDTNGFETLDFGGGREMFGEPGGCILGSEKEWMGDKDRLHW